MAVGQEVYLRSDAHCYYRDIDNDLPDSRKEDGSALSQAMRVASIVFPIAATISRPFLFIANCASNTVRTISSFAEMDQNGSDVATAKTVVATTALVLAFIAPIHSILLITGEDIVIHFGHLYQALKGNDYEKAFKSLAHIVTSALYFALFLSHSVELLIIAFSAQILLGFYTAVHEYNKGHRFEGTGQVVLTALRLYLLTLQVKIVQVP